MTQTLRQSAASIRRFRFFRSTAALVASALVIRAVMAALASILLIVLFANVAPLRANDDAQARRTEAHNQFVRAEALRAALEAKSERERSVKDYKDVVSAYRSVVLITSHAAEVPEALNAAAALYRAMGEQFERMYFDSAIETYNFLLHDYPESRHRETALLAIADIQKNDLMETNLAQETYEDFLARYPRSVGAAQARGALAEIGAAARAAEREKTQPAELNAPGPAIAPATADAPAGKSCEVGNIRVWNAHTYTRLVIDLDDRAKYQAVRLSNPDRIYFDIQNAKLTGGLLRQPIDVPSDGYLKSVHVAQNRMDVVRVVLELGQVKDYSVFEMAGPDRLVVDVYGANTKETKPPSSLSAASLSATGILGTQRVTQPATVAANRSATPPAGRSAIQPVTPAVKSSARDSAPSETGESAALSADSPAPNDDSADARDAASLPAPMHNGAHSLTRALGLKIGRIVIDAGHGGHDTGTIGPDGLMEKDLCLDIALRVGKLVEERLPAAEIVYTRDKDKFVSLEKRTAIANQAKADLFLSIHANSSEDSAATGIETYYLNFNASPGAMEVAARENALSQSSVHDLQDLVNKIARNEKIEESRDLAIDIQDSLAKRLQDAGLSGRNRGVRKAPFVVLIGANMPSVLTEVSFLSNPADELWLKKPENRQRVAEGLYRGVENYLQSTNSLSTDQRLSPASPKTQTTKKTTTKATTKAANVVSAAPRSSAPSSSSSPAESGPGDATGGTLIHAAAVGAPGRQSTAVARSSEPQ